LSQQGNSVVVIDRNESAFRHLSAEFSGFTVQGDAAELSVLEGAKVRRADVFLAATSRDNLNLFAALAAKELFGVPRVAARLFDPAREAIFDELDVVTISPTSLAAEAFILFSGEWEEGDA
jgi:trk system potassium uptake protein TrkA